MKTIGKSLKLEVTEIFQALLHLSPTIYLTVVMESKAAGMSTCFKAFIPGIQCRLALIAFCLVFYFSCAFFLFQSHCHCLQKMILAFSFF